MLPLQGARVRFLVRELRFLYGAREDTRGKGDSLKLLFSSWHLVTLGAEKEAERFMEASPLPAALSV